MVGNKPFVHLFRTPGGYYIYDVNKNVIIKTHQELWKKIRDIQCDSGGVDSENTLLSKMIGDGFLSSNKIKEIIHPADEVLMYHLDRKLGMVTLQVTQQCNLRCDYCAYSGGYENRTHSNKSMDFETAKKGIDFYIEHSVDNEALAFGFYGGEPLVELKLIKKCIAYIENMSEGKQLTLTMTTNGTLLNEEIVQFLQDHNVSLMISLDGPREIHDQSRKFAFNSCGTFDKVMENVNMIKDKFPEYYKKITFNAVLDQKNDFSCLNQFFTDYETVKDINLRVSEIADNYSKNEKYKSEDFQCQLGYEHFKLLLSKIISYDNRFLSKIVLNNYAYLRRINNQLKPSEGLPDKSHHGGPCIPGAQRLFINAHGDMFPCERVNEFSNNMKIGNIHTGFDLEQVRKLLNVGKISEQKCKNCWAFRFCTLCAACADTGNELSADKKSEKCSGTRNVAEYNLKDICTLRENNFDFDSDNWLIAT